MNTKTAAGAAGAAAIVLGAVMLYAHDAGGPAGSVAGSLAPHGLESDAPPTDYSSVTVTNGQRHTVPLDKIISGGPPPTMPP